VKKARQKAIDLELSEGEELVKQFRSGKLELIAGRNLGESFEIKMMQLGAKTKNLVEKQIMVEKVNHLLSGKEPKPNSSLMILSKSRGNPTNLTNMSGLWGQAAVREGRPKRGYKDRLIALNKRNDVGAMAGGYIESSFMEGMNARSYFYHSMGGRQGEVDTGVATKVSGYLYRRLANSLKDLVVCSDGSVRTASNNLIQLSYGEDSVFPMNASKGKAVNVKQQLELLEKK
jgi:DNA-directed RNA polymerase subunit A'